LTNDAYTNPILDADWSDPDVVRVGDDFYLTASSFGRAPGLPLLHSRDLVDWTLVGHALQRLEPATEFRIPRWIGLQRGADGAVHLVHRFAEGVAERDADHPRLAPDGRVRLRIEIGAGARCRFLYDIGGGLQPSGPVFAATPWRWVGALLGLFVLAPVGSGHAGAATFTHFRIDSL
jgi:hypothetical protein